MAGQVEGKVAVVTGGGSGIGRACALRLAAEGADVVVADIADDGGAQTVAQIDALGRGALFVHTDVREEVDCEAMAEAAFDRFGPVQILLAAAGGEGAWRPPEERQPSRYPESGPEEIINRPLEHWYSELAVNLHGLMLTDRAVARRMAQAGVGGSIINIASTAARRPTTGSAGYGVAKAGVVMLTRVLARELGRFQIRVNAIAPGFTETEATERFRQEMGDSQIFFRDQSIRRVGQPEDQANMALFLAGEQASWITGQVLFVNGGAFTG